MINRRVERDEQTVLVVADDPDILIVAQATLAGKGYRILVADGQRSALNLLRLTHIKIHSSVIRAGMSGCEQVHKRSFERIAEVSYFNASVEDGIIHLEGLEPVVAALKCRKASAGIGKVAAARRSSGS